MKGISKHTLTHFQPIFYLNKPGSWFLLAKCVKKHLWKSGILIKDASSMQYGGISTFCPWGIFGLQGISTFWLKKLDKKNC